MQRGLNEALYNGVLEEAEKYDLDRKYVVNRFHLVKIDDPLTRREWSGINVACAYLAWIYYRLILRQSKNPCKMAAN